jgi:hypothetical protein
MTLQKYYNAGTATVANGATAVVGVGTAWLSATAKDDFFRKAGYAVRIDSVTDDNHLTLAEPWPGTSLSGSTYEIGISFDGPEFQLRLRQVLEQINEIASGSGVGIDAFGTAAGKSAYDAKPAGFVYFASDTRSFYYKISDTSGDWSSAISVVGPAGGSGIYVQLSDEVTSLLAGANKGHARVIGNQTITAVRMWLLTASSSGIVQVNIKKNGVSIFTTKISIDATEKTSLTAATPYVLNTTSLLDDDELTFDLDSAGTGAAGLQVAIVTTSA